MAVWAGLDTAHQQVRQLIELACVHEQEIESLYGLLQSACSANETVEQVFNSELAADLTPDVGPRDSERLQQVLHRGGTTPRFPPELIATQVDDGISHVALVERHHEAVAPIPLRPSDPHIPPSLPQAIMPTSRSMPRMTHHASDRRRTEAVYRIHDGTFYVLPMWTDSKRQCADQSGHFVPIAFGNCGLAPDKTMADEKLEELTALPQRTFALSPTSPLKVFWDLLSAIAIAYDLITMPLLAFGWDENPRASQMSLLMTYFWTADFCVSWVSGYHKNDGTVEGRFSAIARRYLTTWFGMDIMVLTVEYVLIALGDNHDKGAASLARASKIARIFRIARLLRMIRLVRVVKLATLLEDICEAIANPAVLAAVNILRLLLGLATIVHYIACGWYAVAAWSADVPGTWLQELIDINAAKTYMYIISFHWAIAQFTPAPNNIHPQNFAERIFAVFVLFLGLVLFSSLLGNITALINQSRQQAYTKLKEAEMIRRFFNDNNISQGLGTRIAHFLNGKKPQKNRVGTRDLPCLKGLPLSLQVDMHFEVYVPILTRFPVMQRLNNERSRSTLASICHNAVTENSYSKSFEVFHSGTRASLVHFLVIGQLEYFPSHAPFQTTGQVCELISPGAWLSEAAMWVHWEHRGLSRAASSCRVVQLDIEKLGHAVRKHHTQRKFLTCCAKLFLERVMVLVADGEIVDDLFTADLNLDEADECDNSCADQEKLSCKDKLEETHNSSSIPSAGSKKKIARGDTKTRFLSQVLPTSAWDVTSEKRDSKDSHPEDIRIVPT